MAAVNAVGRAAGLEPLEALEDTRAQELYERHARRVLSYCRSRLRRQEDAEDAVQTTFLHAVRGLRRGDSPVHEVAWLLGIARNVCLSRIETAGRRGRLELVCDPVDLEASEAPADRRDELIGLESALARLPEQQRRAVLLRDWRGLSYEEVAAQLGVTLANAETLIFRGRRSLAALLDEQPAATRRRLGALGNAGSLLAWAKTSFGGAAVATKLAAAAAVVAVSGAGVAAGTGALERERPVSLAPKASVPSASTPAKAVSTSIAAAPGRGDRETAPRIASAEPGAARRAAAPARTASRPATTPAGAPESARHPVPPEASAATVAPGPAEAGGAPTQQAPRPVATPRPQTRMTPSQPVTTATGAVGTVVGGVSDTVEEAVPPLAPVTEAVTETVAGVVDSLPVPHVPVQTPPVVESVVGALPTVTVTPPPGLPQGPITIDPPKLLP